MNTSKFITILNSSGKPKKEVIDAMGLSYTGFDLSVKNATMKVTALEAFCRVTGSHISEFFPEWILKDSEKHIPNKVSEVQAKYETNYNSSFNKVLQAKDDLIKEQRERINELSELVSMFKSGKIKLH